MSFLLEVAGCVHVGTSPTLLLCGHGPPPRSGWSVPELRRAREWGTSSLTAASDTGGHAGTRLHVS